MQRRIDIEVQKGGRVNVEFTGFAGETCYHEADALAAALKELGLWAIPITVKPKPSTEIEREAGETKETPQKVPIG